ncbi:MAG TPA: YggT family protein [Acidimicrobiales bacterium]|nr:YggT family protein [Acidimicrobiales bacterium]
MIRTVVVLVLEVYLWGILFPRALLSWFPARPGSNLANINSVLYRLTEPVLAPVRRLLPPLQAGGVGLDLSFIIVFLGIQLLIIPAVYNLL